ncbi:MAG: crossover junction endodeoxyribonuclease RuvC [Kofleriaceae bacterium]|nr:crossover junction endodeoxyribonuclease RuvC [Kofleriaceae bacterium]
MRILGIDPGSRVCGYGMIAAVGAAPGAGPAGEVLRYVECGVLTAPEHRPAELRLGEIARGLAEVLEELRPDVVALEEVFARVNLRSALALAQARGMALAVIGLAGIEVASYTAPLVKKTITGRGRTDKEQVAHGGGAGRAAAAAAPMPLTRWRWPCHAPGPAGAAVLRAARSRDRCPRGAAGGRARGRRRLRARPRSAVWRWAPR